MAITPSPALSSDDARYDGAYGSIPGVRPSIDESAVPTGGAGIAFARAANKPIALHPEDKKYGVAITGAQGSGKTAILTHLVADDASDPDCAAIILDPKSDLVDKVLSVIPPWRRVWILDLGAPEFGLNFMDMHPDPATVADLVIGAFRDLNDDSAIQASSDRYLRQSLIGAIALARHEGRRPTLWDAYRLLQPTSNALRADVAKVCSADPEHKLQMTAEFFGVSLPGDLEASTQMTSAKLDAPRNKMERLMGDHRIDTMLRHPYQVSLLDILRNRDILIVRGNIGDAGRGNVEVMMTLMLSMLHATMSRQQVDLAEHERPRVNLVLDEAHMMINDTFAEMLATHRSAGLEVKAALQYTGQIVDDVAQDAWKALLQHRIACRIRNPDEARVVVDLMMNSYADVIRGDQESRDVFRYTPDHLLNIDNFHGLAAVIAKGQPQPAFPIQTIPATENPALIAWHYRAQRERGCTVVRALRNVADGLDDAVNKRASKAAGATGGADPDLLLAGGGDEGEIGAIEAKASTQPAPHTAEVAFDAPAAVPPARSFNEDNEIVPAEDVPVSPYDVDRFDPQALTGEDVPLEQMPDGDVTDPVGDQPAIAESDAGDQGVLDSGRPAAAGDADEVFDEVSIADLVDSGAIGGLLGASPSVLYAELQVEISQDLKFEPTKDFDETYELSQQEARILTEIFEAKALSGAQIGQLFWGDTSDPLDHSRRKMRPLVEAGYVRVTRFQRRQGSGRMPPIYIVTRKAQSVLREMERPDSSRRWIEESGELRRFEYSTAQYLLHDLRAIGWMLAMAHFGIAGLERKDQVVRGWHGPNSRRVAEYRLRNTRTDGKRGRPREMRNLASVDLMPGWIIGGLAVEDFGDIAPDGLIEFSIRRGQHRFAIDALVELNQGGKATHERNRNKYVNYDGLMTAWHRGLRRHAGTGEPPWVIFVCEDAEQVESFARAADKAMTGWIGTTDAALIDRRYPGRERALFVAEVDAYQGTYRALRLPKHPPQARRELGLSLEPEFQQAALVPRDRLAKQSYG